jgi:hypothetical protein
MIEELLKDINNPSSLHCGMRWLVYDNVNQEWNVFKKDSNGASLIYYSKSLEKALAVLKRR